MYRKILIVFMMVFSFLVISLGGYRCATKITHDARQNESRQTLPIDNGGDTSGGSDGFEIPDYDEADYLYEEGYGRDPNRRRSSNSNRNQGSGGSACAGSSGFYKGLADKNGAMGGFSFNDASLKDILFGRNLNYGGKCGRIYLDMSRGSGSRAYSGRLALTVEDGDGYIPFYFISGDGDENRYNRWTTASSIFDRKFYAIFEDDHSAVILRLIEILEVDVGDGFTAFVGAGELYYKMFRIWVGGNDPCYTRGTYVKFAPQKPNQDKRCWLAVTGAFSCRPDGELGPGASWQEIDITGNLRCYKQLGRFYNLKLKEAFNVGNLNFL